MDTPFYTISWYVSDSKRMSFFKDSVHACFFGLAELFLFQNASSFTPVVEPACKYVERCGNSFFSLIDIMVIYYGGSIIMVDT